MIKGFMNNTNVILSSIKFKCLDFSEDNYKELNKSQFYSNIKGIQIINIKGFKKFLRSKDLNIFEDVLYNPEIENNALVFKKELTKEGYNKIVIYKNVKYNLPTEHFSLNKIVALNSDYLKPIFQELKLNQLESLRIFLEVDNPAYFEINIKDGFLIAPIYENE